MTTNKKKLLLPNTMAKAGWDVLIGRDDIEAVPYEPYITMPDLQAALRDTDGIALSLTPLKAPEIAVAERLRVAVGGRPIQIGDKALEVTVSIGLGAHAPGHDLDKLVERADAALYAAKQAGRNLVRV